MIDPQHPDVYQLKVWLQGISPMVWRRLLIRSDSTIADLHYTLQIAFDWSDDHLNQFHIHGRNYGVYHYGGPWFDDDPEQVLLSSFRFRIHERFFYEYNFHDAWRHEIRIEKFLPLHHKRTYPVCIDGNCASPPEDCGGVWTYLQIRHDLKYRAVFGNEIIEDLDDDEWTDETRPVDPDVFSRQEVNSRLQQYAKGDRDWLFSY
jgi:hypothetical protein